MRAILVAIAALSLTDYAFGQTTRTNPSASSTSSTIQSSSSTSPNSPCNPTNPNSPCYSAKSPRNPCYSAINEPCSTTTTPAAQPSASPSPTTTQAAVRAITEDQAKSQIEAKGYSSVSRLRRDANGIWSGKAEKDGLPVNVTLDLKGNVTAN
jgi:cytoskeletal protein RodZ